MRIKSLFLTIAVMTLVQGVTATVRYASPTGTDSNGLSPETPGRLTNMINKLVAGDELYLLDGQYDFTSSVSRQGTTKHQDVPERSHNHYS